MHIHILGIAGQGMTTPLAIELKSHGHTITGSDQDRIYPPASIQLKQASIPVNTNNKTPDLVIVGSSYDNIPRTRQEFEHIKQLNIPYISATNYVASNLIKRNSIIVAGSHGKTTITSLLTWVLVKAGFNPSYFFGGQSLNHMPSLHLTDSDWSVVEGDESINGLDTQAKFLYYHGKYLILTSTNWEHHDSYATATDNLNSYAQLLSRLPPDGILVYNHQDKDIHQILPTCHCPVIKIITDKVFSTQLIGSYNQQNISAVYTLSRYLGISHNVIVSAIKSYRGIARRLQVINGKNNRIFIDDFAQSPQRISVALDAIRQQFPDKNIKVLFEPHASFLQYKSSLNGFREAFTEAREVILGKIKYSQKVDKNNRVTMADFANEIGNKLQYMPLSEQIMQYLGKNISPNDIIVRFSSGGLDGAKLFDTLVNS